MTITNTGEFSFEMRATSGGHDDNFSIILWNEFDYPMGRYYEGVPYRGSALFAFRDEGGIEHLFSYGGGSITGWHDFKWARDAEGWWSFYLDGSNVYSKFIQDSRMTSFLAVSITGFNEQVEWVRVSAEPVPLPGAVLLGAIGLGFANCLLRRSRKNMQQ